MNNNYETFDQIYDDMLETIVKKCTNEQVVKHCSDNLMKLFKGVAEYGFDIPTPIQAKTIFPIFSGKDIIAQSQSGTGKTGAFTIGFLTRINPAKLFPQIIILATTHELAIQIESVCNNISKHLGIKTCLSIGGENKSVGENIKQCKNSHVIIGTPGRVYNIIEERSFNTNNITTFILDEADALLHEDFIDQIRKIIMKLPSSTQMCVFSATFDKNTMTHTKKFMKDPFIITLEEEELSLDIIKQFKVELPLEQYKIDTLFDLYTKLSINQAVIFVNTVKRAVFVYNSMKKNGHQVGLIHGKMTYIERIDILKQFRTGELRAVIATNIISRGIDIQQIGIVFNYDIPQSRQDYLHRIGRSGRYGKIGVAINFVISENKQFRKQNKNLISDVDKLYDITSHYKNVINDLPLPDDINNILMGQNLN